MRFSIHLWFEVLVQTYKTWPSSMSGKSPMRLPRYKYTGNLAPQEVETKRLMQAWFIGAGILHTDSDVEWNDFCTRSVIKEKLPRLVQMLERLKQQQQMRTKPHPSAASPAAAAMTSQRKRSQSTTRDLAVKKKKRLQEEVSLPAQQEMPLQQQPLKAKKKKSTT